MGISPRGRARPRRTPMHARTDTHSKLIGYLLWIFGFMGAHRFYYGKPITGTLWFFTLGLLFVGWIIDLFLIPSMDRDCDVRYENGPKSYNVSWILLTFLGFFGLHRLYLWKWVTALIWFLTFGLFLVGYLYDYWTLNEQVSEANREAVRS
jgi:TM2 domain-containing membrane protein YozV